MLSSPINTSRPVIIPPRPPSVRCPPSHSVVIPKSAPISTPVRISIPPTNSLSSAPLCAPLSTPMDSPLNKPPTRGRGRPPKYATEEERALAKKEITARTHGKPFVEVVNQLREEIDDVRNEMYVQSIRINKLFQLFDDSRY